MRVPGRARFPAEVEVDPDFASHGFQSLEDGGCFARAEFFVVEIALVDARFRGVGVEIEGMPRGGEGVFGVGVGTVVERNGEVKFLSADVALGRRSAGPFRAVTAGEVYA